MSLSKNIVINTLLFFFLFGCSSSYKDEHYKKIETFLNDKNIDIRNYKSLFVLSDKGCLTCNKKYAKLIENYINNDSSLVIVSTKSNMVDISNLLDAKNVILDINRKFYALQPTENSIFVKLNKNTIDTIVEIEANNLKESFLYISKSY